MHFMLERRLAPLIYSYAFFPVPVSKLPHLDVTFACMSVLPDF